MKRIKSQYIVDEKGKKVAIILPIEEYEKLIENLHDKKVIEERGKEKNIRHKEVIKRLKEEGYI